MDKRMRAAEHFHLPGMLLLRLPPRDGGCEAAGLWQPTAHSPASCTIQPSCACAAACAPSRMGASLVESSRNRREPPPFGGRLRAARGGGWAGLRRDGVRASPALPSTGADAEGSSARAEGAAGATGGGGGGCGGGGAAVRTGARPPELVSKSARASAALKLIFLGCGDGDGGGCGGCSSGSGSPRSGAAVEAAWRIAGVAGRAPGFVGGTHLE